MKKRLQVFALIALILAVVCSFACKSVNDSSDSGSSSDSIDSSSSSLSSESSGSSEPDDHEHRFVLVTEMQNGGYAVRYACACGQNGTIAIRLFSKGVNGLPDEEKTVGLQNGVYFLTSSELEKITALSVIYEDGKLKKIFCEKHEPKPVHSIIYHVDGSGTVMRYTLTDCLCLFCGESCFNNVKVVGVDFKGNDVKTYSLVNAKYELSRDSGDFTGLNRVEVRLVEGETSKKLYSFDAGRWSPVY